jgi:hypothetical protein
MGILNEPTVRDELAATIAAGLDSSINDTPLALEVGSNPTDVDYELADIILARFDVRRA